MNKRKLELVVISDVHLGTYGSHAAELLKYQCSIGPSTLILNGDIIDIWQFSKKYWPEDHMKVIKEITSMLSKGVNVYYLTGNHDDMLRRFCDFSLGNFHLANKAVLDIDGKKAWFFHGDVFDISMKHSKWIAKLGASGYDMLILMNRLVNGLLLKMGKEKISFSKKIKNSVKSAVKFIGNFEETVAEIAVESGFDIVACGHIHQPEIKKLKHRNKEVLYLNSGDWVENLTSLEYGNGQWHLYQYKEENFTPEKGKTEKETIPSEADAAVEALFQGLAQGNREMKRQAPKRETVSAFSFFGMMNF
jgi:UDP-2,3-diacylglucosamine pyrophosphatase LpxH